MDKATRFLSLQPHFSMKQWQQPHRRQTFNRSSCRRTGSGMTPSPTLPATPGHGLRVPQAHPRRTGKRREGARAVTRASVLPILPAMPGSYSPSVSLPSGLVTPLKPPLPLGTLHFLIPLPSLGLLAPGCVTPALLHLQSPIRPRHVDARSHLLDFCGTRNHVHSPRLQILFSSNFSDYKNARFSQL